MILIFLQLIWKNLRMKNCNKNIEKFLNFCLSANLHQLVLGPTRGDSVLDLVLVNDRNLIDDLQILEPFSTSDHNQIHISLHLSKNPVKPSTTYRDFYRANYLLIQEEVACINWDYDLSLRSTLDEKVSYVYGILNRLIASYVPIRNHPSSKPIIFPSFLKKMRRNLRKFYCRIKGYKSPVLWNDYRIGLKQYREEVKKYLELKECECICRSRGKFWSYMRSKFNPRFDIPALESDGELLFDDLDKAQFFNDYFCSVFEKDNGISPACDSMFNSVLSQIHFDIVDVFDLLNKLPCRQSLTPDGVPEIFYKKLAVPMALPLFIIFSESLKCGKLPEIWKRSLVIPIFKSGSKTKVENYRPISMTSVACRTLERLIKVRIMDYLEQNSILSNYQYGFRRGRSTLTQLLTSHDLWVKSIDNNEIIQLAYLDFKKAFDKVSHVKLFHVLRNTGISGNLLSWIFDFLVGRRQSVYLNGALSDSVVVASGVPQGSVLGPLLFNIFINDLPSVVKHGHMYLFADDCKVFSSFSRSERNFNAFQKDLDNIFYWIDRMQLTISFSKCFTMTLNGSSNTDFFIGPHKIEHSVVTRDLGLYIDEKLRFDSHCKIMTKKANSIVYYIFRTFKTRDTDFFVKLFKCYVLPLLDYCSQIYSPRTLKDIKLIESVQKNFTKKLPNLQGKEYTYLTRLKILNLDTLELRRLKFDLILLYKIIYGYTDLQPNSFFSFSTNPCGTRTNGLKINHVKFRSLLKGSFFFSRVIKIWNSLPHSVVTAFDVHDFRHQLDNPDVAFLLNKFLRNIL